MKSFLKNIIYFSLTLAILLILISTLLIKTNPAIYRYLYQYQHAKLSQDTTYTNILIGDSSLGNAIDSEAFSRLSKQSTVNCALTGLYGYAGTYNMLKAAHGQHPELKNVIIMQTLDMQTRPVAMNGYVRTASAISDFTELELDDQKDFITEYMAYIRSIRLVSPPNTQQLMAFDYIKQNSSYNTNTDLVPFDKADINTKKLKFLNKIVSYCSKHEINLIYVHGPMLQDKLDISDPYVQAINKHIARTGIQLVPTTIGIDKTHIGDNIDHIHPDYKKDYTSRYFDLLQPYLVN